jgi:hypothetical protein
MLELLESAWKTIDQLRRGREKDKSTDSCRSSELRQWQCGEDIVCFRLWLGEGPYCKGGSFYFMPMLILDTSDPQQLRREVPQTVSGPQCSRCVGPTDIDSKEV